MLIKLSTWLRLEIKIQEEVLLRLIIVLLKGWYSSDILG